MSLLEFACRLRYPSGFVLDAAFTLDAPVAALLGPSGSGKTSILSITAGLRRPDDGRVRLGGDVLFDAASGVCLPPEARGVGYVFQDQLLFPHLSVRDNLLYGWRRRRPGRGRSPSTAWWTCWSWAARWTGRRTRCPAGSGSASALGRALLCGPRLLLLDEPLASLDADLKSRVLDYVEQVLREWDVPTLYVTHDPAEAARLARQTVRLGGAGGGGGGAGAEGR